jgi:hypothetical protein
VLCWRVGSSTSWVKALLFSTSMKSVCRLGAVEFGFKVFSFQFHPGKFMSHPMIIVALWMSLKKQ